jgi:hypothetical protein
MFVLTPAVIRDHSVERAVAFERPGGRSKISRVIQHVPDWSRHSAPTPEIVMQVYPS